MPVARYSPHYRRWLSAGNRAAERELELQRAELALTRKELTGQRLEMEQQTETFRLQIFESSFLTLLGHLRGITGGVGWQVGGAVGPRSFGAEAMHHIADIVRAKAQQELQKRPATEAIAEAFQSIRGHWASAGVSGFLSFLEELLRWIAGAPEEHQGRYRTMLLAQLSQPERDVAALYCATPDGDHLLSALGHQWQVLSPRKEMRA